MSDGAASPAKMGAGSEHNAPPPPEPVARVHRSIQNPKSKIQNRLWSSTFLRFLAVGALNTAFGYGVYALFILLGLQRELALLLATVLGVLFNFKTTGLLVFRSRNPRLLLRFVLVYAAMYAFNAGLLELLCRGVGLGPLVAQALSLPVVVVLTFMAMKTFVFRTDPADGTAASKAH